MRENPTPNVTIHAAEPARAHAPRGRAVRARTRGALIGAFSCVLLVGCRDTRSAARPPPPSGIATGATHATLHDPKGAVAISTAPVNPPRVKDPFDAPPQSSGSADPLAPPRPRPTEL